MAPRDRLVLLEKLAASLERALSDARVDKVTRNGAVLSPYFTKRLHDLIGELSASSEKPTGNT